MGHSNASISELYNKVDEDRQRLVSGSISSDNPQLRPIVSALLEAAKQSKVSLSDLQAELRMGWRETEERPVEK